MNFAKKKHSKNPTCTLEMPELLSPKLKKKKKVLELLRKAGIKEGRKEGRREGRGLMGFPI